MFSLQQEHYRYNISQCTLGTYICTKKGFGRILEVLIHERHHLIQDLVHKNKLCTCNAKPQIIYSYSVH